MAEKWDTVCRHDTGKIKYILNLAGIGEGWRILDVGTGTGVLIPFLWEKAGRQGEITAVDISEKMLEIAQQKYRYDNVSFICCDVLEADLPEEYFDLAVCYSVLPHFGDKQSAIGKIGSYLKKSGKLMICHSQSREAINNLHREASEAVAEDNLPHMDVLKGYMENAGLKTVGEIDNEDMFVIIGEK